MNGIFEPELDETSNFNPDRTPPVSFLAVGQPSYLDASGRLCVTPMTEHTLSAADGGPVGFTAGAMEMRIRAGHAGEEWVKRAVPSGMVVK